MNTNHRISASVSTLMVLQKKLQRVDSTDAPAGYVFFLSVCLCVLRRVCMYLCMCACVRACGCSALIAPMRLAGYVIVCACVLVVYIMYLLRLTFECGCICVRVRACVRAYVY